MTRKKMDDDIPVTILDPIEPYQLTSEEIKEHIVILQQHEPQYKS